VVIAGSSSSRGGGSLTLALGMEFEQLLTELLRARMILGVGLDATPADIRKASRRLASQYHPDRNRDSETNFIAVYKARDLLLSAADHGATGCLPRQFGALVPNAVPTSSVKALLLSIDTGSINTEPEEVLQLPVGSVEASEVAYMEHDDVSKNNDGNGVVDISSRNRPEDVQEPSSDNTSIASGSSGSGSGNDANDHSAVNDVAILACSLVWHEKLKYVVCPSAMAELDRKEFGILNGSTEMRAGFVFCVRAFLLSGNEYDILYGSIFAVTVVLVLRIISWKKKKEEVKAAARIQSWIRHTLRKLRIISWKKKEEEVKAAARIQSWIRQTTLRKSRADAHRTKQRAARFNTWNEDVKAAGISFHVWAMVQLVKK